MDNEFSIKLRLEKLSRSRLFISSCFFLVLFITSIVVSLTLTPEITKEVSVSIFKCSKDHHRDCYTEQELHEIWQAHIPNTSRLNQFLYMSVKPHSSQATSFSLSMDIEVHHEGRILQKRSKSKKIACSEKSCDTVPIFYMPYLEYSSYSVTIKHKSKIESDSVEIDLSYINEKFTRYQIITKFVFFILSLASFIQFLVLNLKVPRELRSFECKVLIPLGISLILFNEPLLIATIYFMNPVWSAYSVFSNLQFLAFLLFFWFFELHHFRNSSFNVVYLLIETIAIGFLFLLSFWVYLYLHQELRNNPTYDWQHDLNEKYKEVFIGVIVVSSVLMLWIFILSIITATQLKLLSFREKIIKMLSLAMIGFAFTGLFIGAFQPIPRYSCLFLIFISGFNFYVISLQYFYSPTQASLLDYQFEKKIEYSLVKSHESESIELS